MPLRFRRRIKLAPGLGLNLSKRGVSLSAGRRGATVNLGKRGLRTTVGIPGTGISYTTRPTGSKPKGTRRTARRAGCGCMLPILAAALIALAVVMF